MQIKLILSILLLLILAGCKKQYSQEYLLKHPDVLKKEIIRCQSETEYTPYCDHIKQVLEDLSALSIVRNNNPELFGRLIMQAELDMVKASMRIDSSQENLNKLEMQKANQAEVQAANQQLALEKQAYEALVQKVNQLLAIVATTMMDR